MKKLIYVFLAVILFAACSNDEFKTDVKQTTLEEMHVAETHADSLYIVAVDGDKKITVFNPITFEKEYELSNLDGLVKTLFLIILLFFILGLCVGRATP